MPGNGSRPEIKEGDSTEVGDGGGAYLATRRGAEGKGYSATQYYNLVSLRKAVRNWWLRR